MAFAYIFVLVIFAFSVDALTWKNCDGSAPLKIGEMNLSPHPLTVRPGEKVTFSGKFTVSGAAGTNYNLDLTLRKAGWFGMWIPVPCFGHCNHKIGCDQLVGLLEGAQCPLPQGTYVIKEQTQALPDISIPSFLLNGKYKITGVLKDRGDDKLISCLEAEVEIRS